MTGSRHRADRRQRPARLFAHAGAWLAALLCVPAHALGLGEIAVQSYLGQPLRATIALVGADDEDALRSCIKARLQTMDGALIATPSVSAGRDGRGLNLIVTSTQKLYEPVITLIVDAACDGRTQREYAILLDPLEWPSSAQPVRPAAVAVVAAPRDAGKPAAAPNGNQVNQAAQSDNRFKPLPSAPQPARPAPRPPVVVAKPSAAMTAQTAPAATPPQAAAKPAVKPAPAAKPSQAAAPVRNVLRLSNADTASAPNGAPESLADTEQRLKDVQVRLLALGLTTPAPQSRPGAKPSAPAAAGPVAFSTALDQTEQQMAEVRAQIRALQIETENMSSKELRPRPAVKRQPAPAAAVAVAAPPPASDNIGLLVVLGVLLVGCVAVIAMMMLRMRQLKKYREHLDPF